MRINVLLLCLILNVNFVFAQDEQLFNDSIFSQNCPCSNQPTIIGERHFNSAKTAQLQIEILRCLIEEQNKDVKVYLELSPALAYYANRIVENEYEIRARYSPVENYYEFLTWLSTYTYRDRAEIIGLDTESRFQFAEVKDFVATFVKDEYASGIQKMNKRRFLKLITSHQIAELIDSSKLSLSSQKYFDDEIYVLKKHGFTGMGGSRKWMNLRDSSSIMVTVGRGHALPDRKKSDLVFMSGMQELFKDSVHVVITFYDSIDWIFFRGKILKEVSDYEYLIEQGFVDCYRKLF